MALYMTIIVDIYIVDILYILKLKRHIVRIELMIEFSCDGVRDRSFTGVCDASGL